MDTRFRRCTLPSRIICAVSSRLLTAFALAVLAGSLIAQEPPSASEQDAFLAEARNVALAYDESLPDFLCTLTIRRYATAPAGIGRGPSMTERLSDTVVVNLSYYQGNEQYTVLSVNGLKPASPDAYMGGLMSTGEFGMVLRNIFDKPAEFKFLKWTSFHSRKSAVYSFRVDASARPYQIRSWDTRRQSALSAIVGLRGELCIDAESHSVLRFSYQSDGVPRGFPISATSTSVEYDYASIAGRRYLLPSAANVRMSGDAEKRNEVAFNSYRKFSSDTSISFENEPAEKEH